MKKPERISRREFAGRALAMAATAAVAPATLAPHEADPSRDSVAKAAFEQTPANETPLTGASAQEADARLAQIFAVYGNRLNDDDKALVKKLNGDLQGSLDRVRAYPLQNGDAPALYLKPLVEREKKFVNKTGVPAAPKTDRKPAKS